MKQKPFITLLLTIPFIAFSLLLFGAFAFTPLFTTNKHYSSNIVIESKYDHKKTSIKQETGQPKFENREVPKSWKSINGIPVLCYHKIPLKFKKSAYDVPLPNFKKQMKWLHENNYKTISLKKFHRFLSGKEKIHGYHPVLITFDDGLRDFLTAEQILDQYNYKAVLFVYPTYIQSKRKVVLTWQQLAAIEKRGHEVESHTYWHPLLNTMTAKEQIKQFTLSKKKIEKYISDKVEYLAYPFGIFDANSVENLPSSGYAGAFTIYEGENLPRTNPYLLKRYMVVHSDTIQRFAQKIRRKTLPVASIHPPQGSYIDSNTLITFSIPRSLNSENIKIFASGKNNYVKQKYDRESGKISLHGLTNLKKYITITIHYREDSNLWQNKLLYNTNSKKNMAMKR